MANMITKEDVEKIKKHAKRGSYRDALELLAQAKGDMLSPYDVLEEARNNSSPLHGAFTWDDTEAGEKYRLMEARILLNTVRVEFMGEKRQAYFNTRVTINDQLVRGYFPVERVMTDADVHEAVLRDAVRELKHAQEKYKQLSELKGVINERKLREVEKRVQR